MSEEYTPTTEEVRDAYAGHDFDSAIATAEFDRWLNVEKAKAWEKGAESAFFSWDIRGFVDYPENPYREESQ